MSMTSGVFSKRRRERSARRPASLALKLSSVSEVPKTTTWSLLPIRAEASAIASNRCSGGDSLPIKSTPMRKPVCAFWLKLIFSAGADYLASVVVSTGRAKGMREPHRIAVRALTDWPGFFGMVCTSAILPSVRCTVAWYSHDRFLRF